MEVNDHIFLILCWCKICEKCDFFLKARFKIVVYVIEITELKNPTRTSLGLEKSPSRAKSLKLLKKNVVELWFSLGHFQSPSKQLYLVNENWINACFSIIFPVGLKVNNTVA